MNIAVVIATCGEQTWSDLAWSRAYPSAQKATSLVLASARVVTEHYPELTVSQARNAATANVAGGEWLCFLDADDELEAGYLAAMASTYLAPSFSSPPLLVPAVRYVRTYYRNGPRSTADVGIPNRGRWPQTNECVIGTLVRADLFRAVGGFRDHTNDGTELTMYEDYDLSLRCYDAGAQLVYVEDAVYRAYVNPSGRNSIHSESVYQAIWADHLARAS